MFSFTAQPHKELPSFSVKSQRENFEKWGMVQMNVQNFSYNNYFDLESKEDFVKAFFDDAVTKIAFKTFLKGSQCSLGHMPPVKYVKVKYLPSTVTNMGFFDRLFKNSVVRSCGTIKKCFDEMIDDVLISDELRKMMLTDESDHASLFTDEEKEEFIYAIFRNIVLGGYCNQYEDDVQPYIDATKYVYKDLVKVVKDPKTKNLSILSTVLKVEMFDENGGMIFPGNQSHAQNFCYFIINPEKRTILIWHHIRDL